MIANDGMIGSNERRWTRGSYAAAGFALFLFLYTLGTVLINITRPTDGWRMSGDLNNGSPQIELVDYFLSQPSPIQPGDVLLAINDQPIVKILDAQHAFFRLRSPNWPDGTRLKYTLLRDEQTINVDVPVQKESLWAYFEPYRHASSGEIVQLFGSLFLFTISVIVFLLRPGSRAAHALLFIGVAFFFLAIPNNFSAPALFYPTPPVSIPFDAWTLAILPGLMYLVLAFPYPKAPLRKRPLLVIALLFLTWPLAFNIAYLLNLEDRLGYLKAAFAIYPIEIVVLMLVTVIALGHSAWKVRDPVGRSQFKWMLAGIFSFVFLGIGGWLVSSYLFPDTMQGGNWLLTTIGWFLLPLCLAIAITRYRLFDIDVIIRKTLVYGVLTISLALIFFGGVALLQSLFSAVSGQQSAISVVVSTLAIAALFNPLRKRVQDFVDRRFYRKKYNAEQTLARFAAVARDETDIEQLSAELVSVVQETMQPESVVLWLRLPAARPSRIEP
jgi:hypothetical protein